MSTVAARVASLFSQLREKKIERSVSSWSQYREVLTSLAQGDDVDLDEIELVLEASAKCREQFAADVETMSKRLSWHEQASQLPAAREQLRSSESNLKRLVDERDAFLRQIQPRIDAEYASHFEAETTIGTCESAERKLHESCIDPAIAEQRENLAARSKELAERESGLREKLGFRNGSIQGALQQALGEERKLLAIKHRDQAQQKSLREWQQIKSDYEQQLATVHSELAAIRKERLELESESKRLYEKSLVP